MFSDSGRPYARLFVCFLAKPPKFPQRKSCYVLALISVCDVIKCGKIGKPISLFLLISICMFDCMCLSVLTRCPPNAAISNIICLLWHMFCPSHAPVWLYASAIHHYGNTGAAVLFFPVSQWIKGPQAETLGASQSRITIGQWWGGAGWQSSLVGLVRVRRLEALPTSGHRDGVTLQSAFLSSFPSLSLSLLLSHSPFHPLFFRLP